MQLPRWRNINFPKDIFYTFETIEGMDKSIFIWPIDGEQERLDLLQTIPEQAYRANGVMVNFVSQRMQLLLEYARFDQKIGSKVRVYVQDEGVLFETKVLRAKKHQLELELPKSCFAGENRLFDRQQYKNQDASFVLFDKDGESKSYDVCDYSPEGMSFKIFPFEIKNFEKGQKLNGKGIFNNQQKQIVGEIAYLKRCSDIKTSQDYFRIGVVLENSIQ